MPPFSGRVGLPRGHKDPPFLICADLAAIRFCPKML
jgi:hypothetical protein